MASSGLFSIMARPISRSARCLASSRISVIVPALGSLVTDLCASFSSTTLMTSPTLLTATFIERRAMIVSLTSSVYWPSLNVVTCSSFIMAITQFSSLLRSFSISIRSSICFTMQSTSSSVYTPCIALFLCSFIFHFAF